MRHRLVVLLCLILLPCSAAAQEKGQELADRIADRCRTELERLHGEGKFPGASLAFVLPEGVEISIAVGHSSKEDGVELTTSHRLPAGSTGKTFVAAVAMKLVCEKKLALDDSAAKWLGEEEWFPRLPNADELTVRNLLNHSSGIPEYYDQPEFLAALRKDLMRTWEPAELIAFVLDDQPRCVAGEGWSYADTNFLLVGLILEAAAKESFYDLARRHLLVPHRLADTFPSDRPDLPGVAQGHVVMGRFFGLPERALVDGVFAFNPQFEWCGGGFASTPLDLAKWARVLYTGKAFEGKYLEAMLDGVLTRRAPRETYGLGTFIQETKAGPQHGHDGFFPGYLTSMGWFPDHGFAAALQLNTDDLRTLGVPSVHLLLENFTVIAAEELAR